MIDHPPNPWRSLGAVAQKVVLQRQDHPTIEEQIDAIEWAEANANQLARLASVSGKQQIGLLNHRKPLSTTQLKTLHARLEAAAETLRMLNFARETLA